MTAEATNQPVMQERARGVRTLADAIADARAADGNVKGNQDGQFEARQAEVEREFARFVPFEIRRMLQNAGWSRGVGRPAPRIRLERGRGLRMEVSHLAATPRCEECWVVMVRLGAGRWRTRVCAGSGLAHHVLVLAGKAEDELRRLMDLEESNHG